MYIAGGLLANIAALIYYNIADVNVCCVGASGAIFSVCLLYTSKGFRGSVTVFAAMSFMLIVSVILVLIDGARLQGDVYKRQGAG